MPSKFGGIPIEEEDAAPVTGSRFGGVAVDEKAREPEPEKEAKDAPESEFVKKLSEYGSKLAYDLGMIPRWGIEGLARVIGSVSDPVGQMMAQATGREYQPLEEYTAEKLTQLGLPEEVGAYEPAGEVMKTVTGAAVPVGVGAQIAKAAPGTAGLTQQVGQTLATAPGAQLTGGATASVAQQAAERAGAGEVGQMAAALGGGMVGAGVTGMAGRARGTQLPEAVQEAEKRGIRVLTEDIYEPKTAGGKILKSATGKILAGTGPQRAAQQAERTKAATKFLREYGADVREDVIDDVYKEFKKKRKFKVARYDKLKTDVLRRLDYAGEVPVHNTTRQIDMEVSRIKEFDPDNPLIGFYNNFKEKFQNKTLLNLEELRDDLGDQLEAFGMAGDPILKANKRRGQKVAKRVYDALREDMGGFIKEHGQEKDYTKWRTGNKRLSEMIQDLNKSALKQTLNKGDVTPETVKSLLFSTKPSDVKMLYKNLPPKGKQNARAALLQDALWRTSKGRIEELSPDIFKNKLRDLQRQTGIFFEGEDAKAIEGMYRALKVTEGAGKAVAAPQTGMQNLPVLVQVTLSGAGAGLGATLGPVGAAIGAVAGPVSVGTAAKVYNSRPVRNILLSLSDVKKGSAEESNLVNKLWSTMQSKLEETDFAKRYWAAMQTQPAQPEAQPEIKEER